MADVQRSSLPGLGRFEDVLVVVGDLLDKHFPTHPDEGGFRCSCQVGPWSNGEGFRGHLAVEIAAALTEHYDERGSDG